MTDVLAQGIPGAQKVTLEQCAHLSAIEQAPAFAEALGEFIAGV
jgi:3-oxoadipate enol-lactonase